MAAIDPNTIMMFETRVIERAREIIAVDTAIIITTTNNPFTSAAFLADMPDVGSSWPSSADTRLEDRTWSIISKQGSNWKVRVDLTYRLQHPAGSANSDVRGGASLHEVETNKAGDSTLLTVQDPFAATNTQIKKVNKLSPQMFHVRDVLHTTPNPDAIVKKYIGKVNSMQYRTHPQTSLLCTNVEYELKTRGATINDNVWLFTFTFEVAVNDNTTPINTWKEIVWFEGDDGKIDPNATDANGGRKQYVLYQEIDFNLAFSVTP